MARIQVLVLPVECVGAFARTPFVLVVDQVDNIDDFDEMSRDYAGIAESTGARTVIVSRQRLDVA